MQQAILWGQFATCALLILVAAPTLAKSAESIASKRGLTSGWVGLILLASVTSLPELAAGISAVTLIKAPDIAVSSVFGSCVFNLLMLAVLDFASRGDSVYRRARQGHILSASFGVVLIGLAGMTLLTGDLEIVPSIGHVGATSLVIAIIYLIATRAIYNYEGSEPELAEPAAAEVSGLGAERNFVFAAIVIVVMGLWLPIVADELTTVTGLGQHVMGSIFIAASTSLPELAVSLAALRRGSVDMAIANLLGSNLFNILILALEDLVYLDGPLLADASAMNGVTAMAAVIMSGVVIAGLLYRPATRLFRTVGWTSIGLFIVYLFNVYILYLHGT